MHGQNHVQLVLCTVCRTLPVWKIDLVRTTASTIYKYTLCGPVFVDAAACSLHWFAH